MLEIEGLRLAFRRYIGVLRRRRVMTLDGIDLTVGHGEMVALFGESGAGKTLLAEAVLGILPTSAEVSGRIVFQGELLTPARQCVLRGRSIALVPQTVGALDPLVRVDRQVTWAGLRAGAPRSGIENSVRARLLAYRLDGNVARHYPHMLSGGMARRVLLAMATIGNADLIIADEPTTGLDKENAAIVLDALRQLADRGKGVLVISHDIPAVLRVADRIVVLRAGKTVDFLSATAFKQGGTELINPYTRALWAALPQNGFRSEGPVDEDRNAGR
ncbi:ATP-binding cassette domain-containing protein [Telmatospirillum sp.]|uniref:ATP-binding cassette domain-containing protein n=1 Tax=Telmatospirillum sp. TaxID=2079197 RepID=UPI002845EC8A|nr:ATP-binding cassette domain-containing protein [Telmatospirillum sp.]MDR3434989.1 ATP-binding cassette domain-containing protein [Telmatospirillum sp.]